MIRNIHLRIFRLEIYAEFPAVTQGRSFFDFMSDGGELLIWAGRFHAIVTPPWWRPEVKRCAGVSSL